MDDQTRREIIRAHDEIMRGVKYIEIVVPFHQPLSNYRDCVKRKLIKTWPLVEIKTERGDPANGDPHKLIIPNPRKQ